MKKTGIITFHNTLNFGAALQVYALNCYVNSLGIPCETINYRCEPIYTRERPFAFLKKRNIKSFFKGVLSLRYKLLKQLKFSKFNKNNVMMGEKNFNRNNVRNLNNIYSCFIVGSDQVWNTDLTENDYTFFLDFADMDKLKIAYAPSVGKSNYNEEESEYINSLLVKFDYLSVREKSSIPLFSDVKKHISEVLDPVFLLSKEEWCELLLKEQFTKPKRKYILVYFAHDMKNTLSFVKKLANNNDLDIILVNNNYNKIKGIKNVFNLSPIDFLNYIFNAEYVVTGSFHALCFSIIFGKQFFYEKNGSKYNTRLIDLAIKIQAEDHVTDSNKLHTISSIDYEKVRNIIDIDIRKSKEYLINALKDKGE